MTTEPDPQVIPEPDPEVIPEPDPEPEQLGDEGMGPGEGEQSDDG
jgi:hypothetical protein